jgi:uncharacterized protein (DUF849 family)
VLIQACLNGSRARGEHPGLAPDAAEIARDARAVAQAGAGCLHVHPRDDDGDESIEADAVGMTTASWIEPDPERRLAVIGRWSALPDFASLNRSEEGALALIDLLGERGIGVDRGSTTAAVARPGAWSGGDGQWTRRAHRPRGHADAR